jgi:flagellar motility protein MotE (MotC chaperone)
MMRSLWIAVSTLALANLLALGGFALWLNSTGRLNKERVEKVRQIFQPTVAQDAAKVAEEKAKAEAEAKAAQDVARDKRAPVTAEQRLAIIREYEETQRQKNERLQRETKDLLNQLEIKRADFEKDKADLLAIKKAFEAKVEQVAKEKTDEQLQKTLKVYEAVKPAEAASMLETMLNTGPKGKDQVVSYLNQMSPRVSSRIVSEFSKKDPVLAADLLEKLRTYGLEARKSGDATPAAPAQGSSDGNNPSSPNRADRSAKP